MTVDYASFSYLLAIFFLDQHLISLLLKKKKTTISIFIFSLPLIHYHAFSAPVIDAASIEND
jgi:hypothetical protein